METEKTKICRNKKCLHGGVPQPIKNFSARADSSDKLDLWCKTCKREYRRERQQRPLGVVKTEKICRNKKCLHGGVPQPIKNFSVCAVSSDKLNLWCKTCAQEYRRKYWQQPKVWEREWRRRRQPEVRERQREYQWKRNLKSHGVTPEWWDDRMIKQDYRCPICKMNLASFKRRPCIDHDHDCPKNHPKGESCALCVRGLPCSLCNCKLNQRIQDKRQNLTRAEQKYLKDYPPAFKKNLVDNTQQPGLFDLDRSMLFT
jgi:hypothetical protein